MPSFPTWVRRNSWNSWALVHQARRCLIIVIPLRAVTWRGTPSRCTWTECNSPRSSPLSAVSRKTHGDAGTFDLPLPLSGRPGIEYRSGGADGEYQVVVTFPTPVSVASASVIPETGKTATVSGPPVTQGNQITVNLSNVSNAQTIAVNLIGLTDGVTTDTISVPMSVLAGDSLSNGTVNSSDIVKIKLQFGKSVTASNYRDDITADGLINVADVLMVESLTGTGIETP